MRQNVPIDEILNSLKKMMDSKSSRISRYLVAKEDSDKDDYASEYNDEEENDEILELTEEAIVQGVTIQGNVEENKKSKLDSSIKSKEGISEVKNKISNETFSETSMYLKYLSDKSAIIKNSKEKTINEFISEAAMPYIIDWLDKNLNKLVKDIVEKEIKRIASDEK